MNKDNKSLPSTLLERLFNGIIKENPTFVLLLGMCPTLAVTTSAVNGLGMGLSTMVVLALSNMLISALRKVIPNKVRIPAFIVIIASFVTIVELLLKAYIPFLYDNLGLYIPLIVVNCIILGRAEAYAYSNPVLPSLFDGIGMGLGFSFALTIIGGVREILGAGEIFGWHFMPASYVPVSIFVMAPGAFFVLAILTAIQNAIKISGEKKGKDMSKIQSGCGGNCLDCEKDCKKPEFVSANGKKTDNKKSIVKKADANKEVKETKDSKEKVTKPEPKEEPAKSVNKKVDNKVAKENVTTAKAEDKVADKEADKKNAKVAVKENTSEKKVVEKEVVEKENVSTSKEDAKVNQAELSDDNTDKTLKKEATKEKKAKKDKASSKDTKNDDVIVENKSEAKEEAKVETKTESKEEKIDDSQELDPEVAKLLDQMEKENQTDSEEEVILLASDEDEIFELIDIDDYKKALNSNKKKSNAVKPARKKGGLNKAKEMLSKAEETVKGETDK